MKVRFVYPPPGESPSGGHVYNRRLIAEAERRGFPLEALAAIPGTAGADAGLSEPGTVVLWDSLFLEALAAGPPSGPESIRGLLIHYLPFLNPTAKTAERRAWERRFDRVVGRMRFLIATGQGAMHRLRRRYPGMPVWLCEPGVDPVFATAGRAAASEPGTAGRVRIVTVANLLPAKGQLELLDSLARIENRAWEWHLAGDERIVPEYAGLVRERAEQYGLAGNLVSHGVLETPALARLLARMDLCAFPSHYESYGLALAEAAAAGLPIVTTAVGEAHRLVHHGETGFVVAVGDREGFRSALSRLMADDGLRRKFRQRRMEGKSRSWEEAFGEFGRCLEAACILRLPPVSGKATP